MAVTTETHVYPIPTKSEKKKEMDLLAREQDKFLREGVEGGDLVMETIRKTGGNVKETIVPAIGDEEKERGRMTTETVPKKRAIALTAFVFCLIFLLMVVDHLIRFAKTIMESDSFWSKMDRYFNHTSTKTQ